MRKKKKKILKSENLKIRVHFETEMFDNGDTKVLARWEIVTCTDVQQKKPVSIFVNGQFVLCIHVHNFKSFCNSKSHLQVFTWWWLYVYLYCGVSYESV